MIDFIWDDQKNSRLKIERGVSFEEVEGMILDGKYIDIVTNPSHTDQKLFLLKLRGYIHVIPFIEDERGNIVLKTVYPSRNFNRIYRAHKP